MKKPGSARKSMGCFLALVVCAGLVPACGGGGGGGAVGDRTGEDTLPVIAEMQTPLGEQGSRGVGPLVVFLYHIRDREFDPADVDVQYGVDRDRDGTIEEDEFQNATSGTGGDGTSGLSTAPGIGAAHMFVWDSPADIATGRFVTQDYVYTDTGRVATDAFGEPIFQSFPGTVVRMRPRAGDRLGAWRYSDPFSLNNNNRPAATVGAVEIPPEGRADETANEQVVLNWTAIDPDEDAVTIAVDWAPVSADYDPAAHSTEELANLPWSMATPGGSGDGSHDLAAAPAGVPHRFAWNSVADAGTVNEWILLRVRPIDAKLEVGDWFYGSRIFHLDNYTIFTDPETSLPLPLGGARAVRLRGTEFETILVTGGLGAENGEATNFAGFFYPGQSETTRGEIHELEGGMREARAGHTATRLLDGRVLVVGGKGAGGAATDTAEIYDPASREFTLLDSRLATPRSDHVAVLLASGDVLVAGGRDDAGHPLASAEVFRIDTEEFQPVDSALSMAFARTDAGAVRLPDGRVLVAGGRDGTGPLATVEIYDPVLGGFGVTDASNDMSAARARLSLTATNDARWVAVAAGGDDADGPLATLERFDPATDAFQISAVSMRSPRADHAAVLLGDGRILLAGGRAAADGTLTKSADLYDPSADAMDLPNGDLGVAVARPAVAVLERGRPVLFGGFTGSGATASVQVFTPDGGFNEPPVAQIANLSGTTEPWSFGARIPWRAIDPEGDRVRIVAQFRVRSDSDDDSGALPAGMKDRWLAATMLDQTVLGEKSSGQSGLGSRKDFVSTTEKPILFPDVDPGEHRFVWATASDLPRGDYSLVDFRILVFGAEEGTPAESDGFSITRNAPVIPRIAEPLTTFGNIVVPYYLQDSDSGELARVVWEYGIDENGDGQVLEDDGESWHLARHSGVDVTVGSTTYHDSGSADLVTGSQDPDPNNDYTDPSGIPWGHRQTFVWDSVYDLGAPASSRSDVILRCTPYDYPAGEPKAESPGLVWTRAGVTLEPDPARIRLTGFAPAVAGSDPSGLYVYAGVKLDEAIVFEFSDAIDPDSLAGADGPNAIQISRPGSGTIVSGTFVVDNSSGHGVVTFYPKVQEIPARSDILTENTGYDIRVFGYDPADRGHAVVKRLGADPADTNARVLVLSELRSQAFKTGTGMTKDTSPPAYAYRVSPGADSDVPTDSKITVEFDDRLQAGTVDATDLVVVAKTWPGVESVITGKLSLENIVDQSGPGGSVRKYSRLTLEPSFPLPPDVTSIEVRVGKEMTGLGGNAVAASTTTTFTTAKGTATKTGSLVENFDDTDRRDAALTTAFWGTAEPANRGTAIGSGTAGKLTGLFDGGTGADGALDLTKGNVTLTSSSDKKEWEFTSVVVPYGRTLTLAGTQPIFLRVQNGATVEGSIDASGRPGETGEEYPTSGTNVGAAGGLGGPGGAMGGSVGKYTYKDNVVVNGSNGSTVSLDENGKGYGHGGTGALYPDKSSYWGAGGGGGAHASAGLPGLDAYTSGNTVGGAGGRPYGSALLSKGLEPGAGGGAGGASVMSYKDEGWYGAGSGGGGGGGGGALLFAVNGRLSVSPSGRLLARGGAGGRANSASAYTTVYPGGGGGGGGGTLVLKAGEFDIAGTVDVTGGDGGLVATATYPGYGGDGGDGRLRLEAPSFRGRLFHGVLTTSDSVVKIGDGGNQDWTIKQDLLVDTDTGLGIPSWVGAKDGKLLCHDFILDAVLTVRGSKPFLVEASGNVEITGRIVSRGSAGSDGDTSHYGSSSGYRFNLAAGGQGAAGAFDGGSNNGSTSYSKSFPDGQDGVGTDGKEGGKGAGKGGVANAKAYIYSWSSGDSGYTRYYYYYAGSGGGGGGATPGLAGVVRKYSGTYSGTPGDGGDQVVSGASFAFDSLTGGTGGGGGANNGFLNVDVSGATSFYSYGPGAGGGGGGGGVMIATSGAMHLSGSILAQGGDGGDCIAGSSSYAYFPGAGGGGAGGNVVLQAGKGFTFGLMRIEAGGGRGGEILYGTSSYGNGGAGGEGAIVLRSEQPIDLPTAVPSGIRVGDGSVTGGNFTPTRYGVSKWLDSGAFAPKYVARSVTDNKGSRLWMMGAQSDPETGEADETKATPWLDVSSGDLSGLNGFRWYRFRVELLPVLESYPEVSAVRIDWTYRE